MMPNRPIFVVTEGETDKQVLSVLIQRTLQEKRMSRPVQILAALGKQPIPHLVHALEQQHGQQARIVIVIDSDGDPTAIRNWLAREINLKRHSLIIANPSLEAWLGLDKYPDRRRFDELQTARSIDLRDIQRFHPEFKELVEAVTHYENDVSRSAYSGKR